MTFYEQNQQILCQDNNWENNIIILHRNILLGRYTNILLQFYFY